MVVGVKNEYNSKFWGIFFKNDIKKKSYKTIASDGSFFHITTWMHEKKIIQNFLNNMYEIINITIILQLFNNMYEIINITLFGPYVD